MGDVVGSRISLQVEESRFVVRMRYMLNGEDLGEAFAIHTSVTDEGTEIRYCSIRADVYIAFFNALLICVCTVLRLRNHYSDTRCVLFF